MLRHPLVLGSLGLSSEEAAGKVGKTSEAGGAGWAEGQAWGGGFAQLPQTRGGRQAQTQTGSSVMRSLKHGPVVL